MPRYDRGGVTMKTGRIGKLQVVRQQILAPGERINMDMRGACRLAPLRERESIRIHVRLDAFATPVRWLWPDITDWLKEGPATTKVWPTATVTPDQFGIGGSGGPKKVLKPFVDAPIRIFNEWYKWPEDNDQLGWPDEGPICVSLAHSWSRLHDSAGGGGLDSELTTSQAGSREKFDLRELAELEARFRHTQDEEWVIHGRYVDLLRQVWNSRGGSREVDQVPLRLRGAEAGVDPQNISAFDSDGLGSNASLYRFGIDHRVSFSAPEHFIVSVMLLVRFTSVAENEISPLAGADDRGWAELAGEPGQLAALRPQEVKDRNFSATSGSDVRGYLPSGWEWRARWNTVGARIDDRDSFPLYRDLGGVTAGRLRDASRIGQPFLSSSLGDYMIDLEHRDIVMSPIPGPKSSIYAGGGRRVEGSDYPYPGPRRVV